MRKSKTQKGVTLIALIITIIVLLILAVVTINAIQGDGIIQYAKKAQTDYTAKANEEQETLNTLEGQIGEAIGRGNNNDETSGGTEYEGIFVETDCAKYYANLDEDEDPEGIIYIDKAKTASNSWSGNSYTITNATEGLKEYYISKESHTTKLGTAPVLSLVPGSTGEERFYVMGLEDEKTDANTTFYWYCSGDLMADYSTVTSTGIGAGKTNTANMITKWNAGAYGAKNDRDVWGLVKEGWYIPSKDEWAAFAKTFEVTSSNYGNLGLSEGYWSSSGRFVQRLAHSLRRRNLVRGHPFLLLLRSFEQVFLIL